MNKSAENMYKKEIGRMRGGIGSPADRNAGSPVFPIPLDKRRERGYNTGT